MKIHMPTFWKIWSLLMVAGIIAFCIALTGCATYNIVSGSTRIGPINTSYQLKVRPPAGVTAKVDIDYDGPIPSLKFKDQDPAASVVMPPVTTEGPDNDGANQ